MGVPTDVLSWVIKLINLVVNTTKRLKNGTKIVPWLYTCYGFIEAFGT